MADAISVHPVRRRRDRDTLAPARTLRLRVLDAATGKPVVDAHAESPVVDAAVLDRLGIHPFRVLSERSVVFGRHGISDFSFGVRSLRAWVPVPGAGRGGKRLEQSWTSTGEIVHPSVRGGMLQATDGSALFFRIDARDERYVLVRDGGALHARRDLITNRKGLLELPLPRADGRSRLTVKLRDHLMLVAPARARRRALAVELRGDPLDNRFWLTGGEQERPFVDEIELEIPSGDGGGAVDATVWVVRRIRPADVLVPADVLPEVAPGGCTRQGVTIHYNSGYDMSERRGGAARWCREALRSGEDDHMMLPQMVLWLLKRSNGDAGTLGYHYLVDRRGTVYRAVAETSRVSHAGLTREPDQVTARENVDAAPRTIAHRIDRPREALNRSHVGICLVGHHDPGYACTAEQHWYLDRLIENLRARCPEIVWSTIVGHDEARAAWRAHRGITDPDAEPRPKTDPGAALRGGAQSMVLLRGRHGAAFG
jgi:hypothetical protein